MTPRQKQVLDFIRNYLAKHGYSPSYQEITDGIGIKTLSTAHNFVRILEKKGLVFITPNSARGIRLAESCPTCNHPLPQSMSTELVNKLLARPVEEYEESL